MALRTVARPTYRSAPAPVRRPAVAVSAPPKKITQPKPKPRTTVNTTAYDGGAPLSKPGTTKIVTTKGSTLEKPNFSPSKSAADMLYDSKQKSDEANASMAELRAEQKAGLDHLAKKATVAASSSRGFFEGDGGTYNARGTVTKLNRYATETTNAKGKSKKYDESWDAYNKALREMRFRVNKTVNKKRKNDQAKKLNRGGLGAKANSSTQRRTLALTAKALRDEE